MKNTGLVLLGLRGLYRSLAISIVVCFVSCASDEDHKSGRNTSKISKLAEEDAYLVDMTRITQEDSGPVKVVPSVHAEMSVGRLSKVVARAMEIADLDQSQDLSWEEFSVAVEKIRDSVRERLGFQPAEQQKARVTARIKAEFEKAAGEDELLDEQELISLLKANAPRISQLRARGLGLNQQN